MVLFRAGVLGLQEIWLVDPNQERLVSQVKAYEVLTIHAATGDEHARRIYNWSKGDN